MKKKTNKFIVLNPVAGSEDKEDTSNSGSPALRSLNPKTRKITEGIIKTFIAHRLRKNREKLRHKNRMAEIAAKKSARASSQSTTSNKTADDYKHEAKVNYHSGQYKKYAHVRPDVAKYHASKLYDLGYSVKKPDKKQVTRTAKPPHAGLYQWEENMFDENEIKERLAKTLNELSKKTLRSYARLAGRDHIVNLHRSKNNPELIKKAAKRNRGYLRAMNKLMKESTEPITEISKKVISSYVKKAASQLDRIDNSGVKKDKKFQEKYDKRDKALKKAVCKLHKEEESVEELAVTPVDTAKKTKPLPKTKFKFGQAKKSLEKSYNMSMRESIALISKAQHSGYPVEVIREVFYRGIKEYNDLNESDLTPAQFAWNRINSFIAGGEAAKLDEDLLEMKATISHTGPKSRNPRTKSNKTWRMVGTDDEDKVQDVAEFPSKRKLKKFARVLGYKDRIQKVDNN